MAKSLTNAILFMQNICTLRFCTRERLVKMIKIERISERIEGYNRKPFELIESNIY